MAPIRCRISASRGALVISINDIRFDYTKSFACSNYFGKNRSIISFYSLGILNGLVRFKVTMALGAGSVDRRRNLGPEVSVRPVSVPTAEDINRDAQPLLNSEYIRADGRYPEQLQTLGTHQIIVFPYFNHLEIRPNVITRAPGSVYLAWGKTKLFCSVYGPRTPTSRTMNKSYQALGNVSCEVNFATFSSPKRLPHQPVSILLVGILYLR